MPVRIGMRAGRLSNPEESRDAIGGGVMSGAVVAEQAESFAQINELEHRAMQFEGIVAEIKRAFLGSSLGGDGLALARAVRELRWQLDQSRGVLERVAVGRGIAEPRLEDEPGDTTGRRARIQAGLRGSTRTLRIPDLLGMLSSQRKTGTLTVHGGKEQFVLELLQGAVVHLVSNRPRPEQRLGTILVARNRISAARLEGFLAEHPLQGPIGAALTRENLVSEEDLRDALTTQVREIFRRLFELTEACFSFVDGKVSDLELRVCVNTMQLLLDSARQRDETSSATAAERTDDQVT